ncbi:hypothetical protein [Arthrobacter humicola]|uniref:hypothetical protein n=1 Tax=Arthrobacter humicola TaxID=409291 RepID=UPI001FAD979D|nr:hypothetical protein [Arthrobacter humicola]MCI9872570.1 hypothetical protein [Arthrobacter humicola]
MSALLVKAREFELGGMALTRLGTLAAGLGANVFVIALLSRQHGAATYAAYALIASLVNLLPFADLGLGASVVNATADNASGKLSNEGFSHLVSRARDYMLIVALCLIPATLWGITNGQLSVLLGDLASEPGILLGAGFTLICIAGSIPLGIGARILQGHGRMLDVVRLGFIGPAVQMLIYIPLWLTNAPAYLYFFGPGTAYLLNAFAGFMMARRTSKIRLHLPFAGLFLRINKADSPWHTAAPFLIISVGMAVGFQSHRLMLSQFGTAQQVAAYSVVAQFLGPLLAIAGVVGQNLWSRYRGQLNRNELDLGSFRSHLVIFAVIGATFAGGFILLIPVAAALITGGAVSPSLLLTLGAGSYLIVFSLHQPSAMLLTDPRALWFQAACVVAVAVSTVTATIQTVGSLGAAAPYICMAVSMFFIQVLPSMRLAISRVRKQSTI